MTPSHPAHLRGRDIGLWYAWRETARTLERDRAARPIVSLPAKQQASLRELLGDLRAAEAGGTAAAGADTGDSTSTGSSDTDAGDPETDPDPNDGVALLDAAAPEEPVRAVDPVELLQQWGDVAGVELGPDDAADDAAADVALECDARARHPTVDAPLRASLAAGRAALPATALRDAVLAAVATAGVAVVSGATGSGKTTQVPQFLLDAAPAHAPAHVLCTQPRRISAMTVAERVARERGEAGPGGSVGFRVRLDSVPPRATAGGSITFATPGVVLRRLARDPLLLGVTHVVLDEVHERDLLTDLLATLLRDVRARRPSLAIVLMSATLDAPLFAAYFGGCPVVEIPGRTHPVAVHFLEDVLEHIVPQFQAPPPPPPPAPRRRGHGRPPRPATGKSKSDDDDDDDDEAPDPDAPADNAAGLADGAGALAGFSARTRAGVAALDAAAADDDPGDVCLELVHAVLRRVVAGRELGAVLVFLSGWEEIAKLHARLQACPQLGDARVCCVRPLHSLLPPAAQRLVFTPPEPAAARKVVLATNMAETSVTIDDVVFVVDAGRGKEKDYDPVRGLDTLRVRWVSRAAAEQRAGRAGRCAPGVCFRLYSRARWLRLAPYPRPELLRSSLDDVVLQVKQLPALAAEPVAALLGRAVQPPPPATVARAVAGLVALGALDPDSEALTPLGRHLALLPVPPRVGKLLLLGALLQCVGPVLTIAAGLGFRDPFVVPLARQAAADARRRALARGACSDHLTLAFAFADWQAAAAAGSAAAFCWDNFLNASVLAMIDKMRLQFAALLHSAGFLASPLPVRFSAVVVISAAHAPQSDAVGNVHATNWNLVKAVLCAALYPSVVKVLAPAAKDVGRKPPKLTTRDDGRVLLHPRSVLSAPGTVIPAGWLVYHKKVCSRRVFVHDVTPVTPLPLLLFGGSLVRGADDGQETVSLLDGFVVFRCPKATARLVRELQAALAALLAQKLAQPRLAVHAAGRALIAAVVALVTREARSAEEAQARLLQGKRVYARH